MNRDEDLKFIRDEFRYLGVQEFPEKAIADMVNSGADKFKVVGEMEFSQYGTRQDMCYKIFFKKYDRPNLYQPYVYQATLKDSPEKTRAFPVSVNTYFTMQDAFNLLNGRAVQKLVLDLGTRKMQNTWFQMNFSEKDEHGNFKLDKLDIADQDYAIGSALTKYPIKELMNTEDRINLIVSLQKGNAELITLIKGGKEVQGFVQASPNNKSVDVFTSKEGNLLGVKKENMRITENHQQEPIRQSVSQKKQKGMSL